MPSDYELTFFREHDLVRQRCPSCGRHYWSQGQHDNCGETPCQEYLFIGASPMTKQRGVSDMRETFLRFFEERGHARVRRYPVVARWRDDVFYTQASVYPFQPWVIEGVADPPANPLCISQPCVRFDDLDNVGKTGQHFSFFEMMAHHVFNFKDRPIYFKERTAELCHAFMTEELGIPADALRYVESDWAGGGYSGPCFEVTTHGAEVATLVFMMYRGEGAAREPMDTKVVDTGYGLERLTWVSLGAPSAYEAVFGEVLETLKEAAGVATDPHLLAEYSRVAGGMKVETHGDARALRERVADRVGIGVEELVERTAPLEHLYAVCDHARALVFVLGDGVVPSNVKEGYFARLLVRRALRSLDALDLDLSLEDVLRLQIRRFAPDFRELEDLEGEIRKLARVEASKYAATLRRGHRIVREREARLGPKGTLSGDLLVELYDSHGLVPEVVQAFAEKPVEIPDDFYTQVAARHLRPEEGMASAPEAPPFPPTELAYYEDLRKFAFRATLLGTHRGHVVLDRTYFYPEGGGQEADRGTIDGHEVLDVQLVGGVVLHKVRGGGRRKPGTKVECQVDGDRRMRLLRHHTATHIVNGAARKVLGRHVWQTGAHKSEERATLDITHYENLTEEELRAVEDLANEVVLQDRPVHQAFLPRDEAEAAHGFVLYQGGSIPGGRIRVVDIDGFDVEGCGGTHAFHTGEVGLIKVLRSRRIQDGVVRLEYVAGQAALEHVRGWERTLAQAGQVLRTKPEDLPRAVRRLFEDWKALSRRLERLRALEVAQTAQELRERAEEVAGVRLVVHAQEGRMEELVELAKELLQTGSVVCVLGARDGSASLLVGRSGDVDLDAREVLVPAVNAVGGSGGGKPDFAQGGGPRVDRLNEALRKATEAARRGLQG